MPLADIVIDIHSGGKTLDFLPFAASHILQDKALQQETEQLVAAFSAPYSLQMLELDSVGMFDTAVEDAGKIFVTTELGGGGSSSAKNRRDCGTWDYQCAYPCGNSEWRITIIAYRIFETR